MVIGYLETGEVRIYENMGSAMSEWSQYPTDIVSEVIIFYDDDGTWLKPIEKYAPRTWYRWFKKLDSVELIRADEKENYQDSLGYLLKHEANSLAKNNYVSSLNELRNKYPHNE